MGGHLGKVLVLNGIVDAAIFFAPGVYEGMALFKPMETAIGAHHAAVLEVKRTVQHVFLLHGVLRVLAGLNLDSNLAKKIAITSYIGEMLLVAPAFMGNDNLDQDAVVGPLAIPLLMIALVVMHKGKGESKKD